MIGHSLGRMIAEKLLGGNLAAAAIGIDAAQAKSDALFERGRERPANIALSGSNPNEQETTAYGGPEPFRDARDDGWTKDSMPSRANSSTATA